MKKIKNIFKLIGTLLICTICVFLSACAGGWDLDDIDEEELDDYQLGITLDNIKVLRRSYGEDKATNNAINQAYYDDYVENLILYLNSCYGLFNNTEPTKGKFIFAELISNEEVNKTLEETTLNQLQSLASDTTNDNYKYFYDAIRHQIISVTSHDPSNPTKYVVEADTSTGWNWGTNYILTDGTNNANSFIYEYGAKLGVPVVEVNGTKIKATFAKDDFTYNTGDHFGFYGYYESDKYASEDIEDFSAELYNSSLYSQAAESQPTEFEKALSYALYCIINNETPKKVTVTKEQSGNTFSVESYSSVDDALTAQKEIYSEKASYVGLTKSDQEKLVEYILNTVIGEKALSQSNKAGSLQDLYYEEIVTAVVAYCATLTDIGGTSVYADDDPEVIANPELKGRLKDPTYISGQYLSSDIVDYEYSSGYVNGELDGILEFAHLGEYEYQSMLLMPLQDVKIDEIWLDFGYLGNGGTNDHIKIKTYIRFYKGKGEFETMEQVITVKENSIDVGEDGTTLTFDFSSMSKGYVQADAIDIDDAINSLRFQERRKGTRPLKDYPKEITIGAMTEARNYYSLIEGQYRDYGVFNHEVLKGTEAYDKCYVEIAFEVIEATCDNYKFLCGPCMITEYEEFDASQWH